MKMHKLFSCYYALVFLSIMFIFYNFPPISDEYQYDKTNTNSNLANEILQNKPQSNAVLYSTNRYLKYQEKFPNVPIQFLYEMNNNDGHHCYNNEEKKHIIYNEKNIKKLFNITLNNQYWQEYVSRSGIFYLYNAYLDTRSKESLIRIPAIVKKVLGNAVHRCAIWYNNSAVPDISVVPIEIIPINRHTQRLFIDIPLHNNLFNYLLTCKISDKRGRIPQAVSIVDHNHTHNYKKPSCYETANYLKVNHNHDEKKDFAVCVKNFFFQKYDSTKLIEWIELLSILGAQKIFLYELDGNPDVWKVFDFYTKKGILHVKKCAIPGDPNFRNSTYLKMHLTPLRHDSVIFLNDCLYRNIHKYKFLGMMDPDEVIVPRQLGVTWSDMMTTVMNTYKNATSYIFESTYFFDDLLQYKPLLNGSVYDIPKTSHMLRHIYRSKKLGKGKSFLNTEYSKKVSSHRVLDCITIPCQEAKVNSSLALVHHYRSGCQRMHAEHCDEEFYGDIVLDKVLWEFKDKLVSRFKETLSKLDKEK